MSMVEQGFIGPSTVESPYLKATWCRCAIEEMWISGNFSCVNFFFPCVKLHRFICFRFVMEIDELLAISLFD